MECACITWCVSCAVTRPNLISPGLRRTAKDDTYDNFFIPKGSIVIANIRGFLEDPRDYVDPEKFNPDRFMRDENGFSEKDPRQACSGNGRRICPGFALADSELFIAYALILAVFDISRKSASNPDANYFLLDGLVRYRYLPSRYSAHVVIAGLFHLNAISNPALRVLRNLLLLL